MASNDSLSPRPDPMAVLAVMRRVAAEEIVPRFRNLATADIAQKKGPQDLVTVADLEAERRLAGELTALLPGSTVVGEEEASRDPGVLGRLDGGAPVWMLDPVDGTYNYAHGKACVAVIVALASGGETVAGWILDPLAGMAVWAVEGGGAWEEAGEATGSRCRLHVAPPVPLAAMRGSVNHRLRRKLAERAATGTGAVPGEVLRWGCSGQEYMALARGTIHFAHYRSLKPWDHAAGVLIHAEAGGYGALTSGQPYRPLPRVPDAALLLAPDRAGWNTLLRTLESG